MRSLFNLIMKINFGMFTQESVEEGDLWGFLSQPFLNELVWELVEWQKTNVSIDVFNGYLHECELNEKSLICDFTILCPYTKSHKRINDSSFKWRVHSFTWCSLWKNDLPFGGIREVSMHVIKNYFLIVHFKPSSP